MKKILVLLMCILLATATGCGIIKIEFLPEEETEEIIEVQEEIKTEEIQEETEVQEETLVIDNNVKVENSQPFPGPKIDKPQSAGNVLPFSEPVDFVFSSGAGGWATELKLLPSGKFTGEFYDSDMGVTGDGYPNGTCYICKFEGQFTNVEKVWDGAYKMTLSSIKITEPSGDYIEDGILYVKAAPYGLEGGYDFMFYTPDADINAFSEEFLSWWPGRFDDKFYETLEYYGIENVSEGYGFFSY